MFAWASGRPIKGQQFSPPMISRVPGFVTHECHALHLVPPGCLQLQKELKSRTDMTELETEHLQVRAWRRLSGICGDCLSRFHMRMHTRIGTRFTPLSRARSHIHTDLPPQTPKRVLGHLDENLNQVMAWLDGNQQELDQVCSQPRNAMPAVHRSSPSPVPK